jgi:pyruvate-formate lyase-activating enzyme
MALQRFRYLMEVKDYDEIIFSGGEPLLVPARVEHMTDVIKSVHDAPIYLYTAKLDNPYLFANILEKVDGMTVTLHEESDIPDFIHIDEMMKRAKGLDKSMRLNVFKEAMGVFHNNLWKGWNVQSNMVWIKDCPIPSHETVMRI